MNDSPFDPQTFMQGTIGGSMSTKREVIPPGVYPAFIESMEPRRGIVQKEGSAQYGKPWTSMNFRWEVEDPVLAKTMNQDKVFIYQSVMLEFDEEGQLDLRKGKNVALGKLREAIGLNTGAIKWENFLGRPASLKIVHEIYKGDITHQVDSVAKR